MPVLSKMNLKQLRALGFDLSVRTGAHRYTVVCSGCEALIIDNAPKHERNCPNIPIVVRYMHGKKPA